MLICKQYAYINVVGKTWSPRIEIVHGKHAIASSNAQRNLNINTFFVYVSLQRNISSCTLICSSNGIHSKIRYVFKTTNICSVSHNAQ